jgi:tight adherence protein C
MDLLLDQRLIILVAVFAATILLVLGVGSAVQSRVALRQRLSEGGVRTTSAPGATSLRADATKSAWARVVAAIETSGLSLADSNQSAVADRLALAGFTAPEAPRLFTLVRLVSTLLFPTLFLLTGSAATHAAAPLKTYLFGALFALFGLYLPNLIVAARAARRQQEIVNGFPDALDLMLVCVEAGLGLESAFDRVGRELSLTHPLVAQLLGSVVIELRAGRSREDALRRMAQRARVDEIRSFAILLIQSDKLGSSIGQTLRVYAAEMREKRRMRAEEKAHRLPVLLSIPLVTCMLPVMIGVLMLPAAIRVIRDVLPAMVK